MTVAVADLEGSAWAVAATETTAGVGRLAGAVYNPLTLLVPPLASPPVVPLTAQKTAVFELPVTAALNCRDRPRVDGRHRRRYGDSNRRGPGFTAPTATGEDRNG